MQQDSTIKPQPTLKGYYAWVISKMVEIDGKTPAEITAKIVEEWVDAKSKVLANEYGVSRKKFTETQAKIVQDEKGSILRHPGSRRPSRSVPDVGFEKS